MMLRVEVWKSRAAVSVIGREYLTRKGVGDCIAAYYMDYTNDSERRRFGENCRNAFDAGQVVITYPVTA